MSIVYNEIGKIETQWHTKDNIPIQPTGAKDSRARIIINKEYALGLDSLDGFSHAIILYHLHKVEGFSLMLTPFLDDKEHGVFSTRSPKRPNPIGLSVVKIVSVAHNVVVIENADMLNGSIVLDIKPYVPHFDHPHEEFRLGWLEGKSENAKTKRSDNRFS